MKAGNLLFFTAISREFEKNLMKVAANVTYQRGRQLLHSISLLAH